MKALAGSKNFEDLIDLQFRICRVQNKCVWLSSFHQEGKASQTWWIGFYHASPQLDELNITAVETEKEPLLGAHTQPLTISSQEVTFSPKVNGFGGAVNLSLMTTCGKTLKVSWEDIPAYHLIGMVYYNDSDENSSI